MNKASKEMRFGSLDFFILALASVFLFQISLCLSDLFHVFHYPFAYFPNHWYRIKFCIGACGLCFFSSFALLAFFTLGSWTCRHFMGTVFKIPRAITTILVVEIMLILPAAFLYHSFWSTISAGAIVRNHLETTAKTIKLCFYPSLVVLLILISLDILKKNRMALRDIPEVLSFCAACAGRIVFFPLWILSGIFPPYWKSKQDCYFLLLLVLGPFLMHLNYDYTYVGKMHYSELHRILSQFCQLVALFGGIGFAAFLFQRQYILKRALIVARCILAFAFLCAIASCIFFSRHELLRSNAMVFSELQSSQMGLLKKTGFLTFGEKKIPNISSNRNDSLKTPIQSDINLPVVKKIIFITIDSWRADHFDSKNYGRETSPLLSEYSKKCVVFERAYSPGPHTTVAFFQIFSGNNTLKVEASTDLMKILDDEGVQIGHYPEWLFFETPSDAKDYKAPNLRSAKNLNKLPNAPRQTPEGDLMASELFLPTVGAFLNEFKSDSFFLWLHFLDAHFPYKPAKSWDRFGNTPKDKYDSELLYTDHQVGKVLSMLNDTGQANDTLVIITADHGEAFGDHGYFYHGYKLYESMTHVPLMFYHPMLKPRRVQRLVSLLDITPTVLTAMSKGKGLAFEGKELWSFLLEKQGYSNHPIILCDPPWCFAICDDDWRLIWSPRGNVRELFNVKNDPGQIRNLVEEEPEVLNRLFKSLIDWHGKKQITIK